MNEDIDLAELEGIAHLFVLHSRLREQALDEDAVLVLPGVTAVSGIEVVHAPHVGTRWRMLSGY